MGTLSGTVTNSLSGAPVEGVAVTTDPEVDGVAIVTDAAGQYSAELPIGVYALEFSKTNFETSEDWVSLIAAGTATRDVALEPVAAVVITTSVDGEAVPDGELSVAATVDIMDGSSLVGATWTQVAGAPVEIVDDAGNASVTLPSLSDYKDALLDVLEEERGVLDRNQVLGTVPLDLEEAALVVLELDVETSSGSYTEELEIHAELSFVWSPGLRNVPVDRTVLLHGKDAGDGGAYDWTITAPEGSAVTALEDADTQTPYFTPDLSGNYVVTEQNSGATIELAAGTWVGAIGADGEPSSSCTGCHNGNIAPDKFTTWKASGHAMIFTDNLNAGGHYGSGCFPCHTVGFDVAAANNGFDDAPGYADFLDEFFPGGHAPTPSPDNWTNMLAAYPQVAQLANIQCENCHGPNNSPGHMTGEEDGSRIDIASEVCGVCHGEPPRHARFQQWAESGHGNYDLAILEATVEGRGGTARHCGRCHAGQGFLAWIDQGDLTLQIQGANGNATEAELAALGLTNDTVHPQTCAVCHDPHDVGTSSGEPNNAKMRISGDTPLLPAGYKATGVGRGAICITCHNTRNGAHNDENPPSSYSAPHTAAQGDVLMGQNAYFVEVHRSPHSFIEDTCATCHLEFTPPPAGLSYNQSGTNHTFEASLSICSECHGAFDGGTLQEAVEEELHHLGAAMAADLMAKIDAAGGTVFVQDYTPHEYEGAEYDVRSEVTEISADNIGSMEPTEPHGQQGFLVKFKAPVDFTYKPANGPEHTLSLAEAEVQLGNFTTDGSTALVATSDVLVKVGWNYFLIHGDGSEGVHNPRFTLNVIMASEAALDGAM